MKFFGKIVIFLALELLYEQQGLIKKTNEHETIFNETRDEVQEEEVVAGDGMSGIVVGRLFFFDLE